MAVLPSDQAAYQDFQREEAQEREFDRRAFRPGGGYRRSATAGIVGDLAEMVSREDRSHHPAACIMDLQHGWRNLRSNRYRQILSRFVERAETPPTTDPAQLRAKIAQRAEAGLEVLNLKFALHQVKAVDRLGAAMSRPPVTEAKTIHAGRSRRGSCLVCTRWLEGETVWWLKGAGIWCLEHGGAIPV